MTHGVVAGPAWPVDGSPERDDRRPERLGGHPVRLGALTFVLAQAVLLFWWAARYPGLFSPDSLHHVWQATTGDWNTHHPVGYTALVWLSVQLTGGIGALTLVQTTALAAGLAYAVTGLRRLGGPAGGWVTAAVLLVALPPVGTFAVCVWKDVPFVICHVFLLGTVARLLARRRSTPTGAPAGDAGSGAGHWPDARRTATRHTGTVVRHGAGVLARRAGRRTAAGARPEPRDRPQSRGLFWALLGELTLICLFRQNGFVVVAIVSVLLAVLLRGTALRVLLAGTVAATVALLTNWALLPALGTRDTESLVAFETFLADLAVGYAEKPSEFPAADLTLLAQVAPLAHWQRSANCHTVDPTVYHPDFDRRAAAAHRGELLSAWWRLARRAPETVLAARVCRSSIAWRPTPAGGLHANPTAWALPVYLERDQRFQREEVLAVAYSRPLGERISDVADVLSRRVGQPEWLLWRGATWAYLAYLTIGLLAWRRRDRALLALATLSLGNQLSVLLVNHAQAARYMAAPFVLGVLLLPLLLARDPDRPASGGRAAGDPAAGGTEPPLRVTELTVVAEPVTAGPPAQPDLATALDPTVRTPRLDTAGWLPQSAATSQVEAAEEAGLRAPPFGPADWWTDSPDRSR
ncbi:hypothetical protein ACN27G_03135 [Plantactinospora sp. WMMB334]|uniref:hypothetical protein n=1 Tax=Plantactinospora sp. WMMB334 TaxID=3404119 RepID=UPI003B952C56